MAAEIVRMFVGLVIFWEQPEGAEPDPSALAVVEWAELILDDIDYVTYERLRAWRWRVLFLLTAVVERVRQGAASGAVRPMRAGDGCDGLGHARVGYATGGQPGMPHHAGVADGRGAGELREW